MTPPDIYYKRSRFSTRLPWDRLYTASHFWVVEAGPGRWRVGFTRFAMRMLGDIVDQGFEVAKGGDVKVGQTIGSLEGFKARTELYSVADGTLRGGYLEPEWTRRSTLRQRPIRHGMALPRPRTPSIPK